MESFNQALVGKWLWRYLEGSELLWTRIVKSIYGEIEWGEEGFCLSRRGRMGTGWWGKIIAMGGCSNKVWFSDKIVRRVGSGLKTLFWSQKWVGGSPLKLVFPRLFQLSHNKEARIGELGKWVEGVWEWELTWRRELRVRETEMVQQLYSYIANCSFYVGEEDRWVWSASPDGVYTTKAAYSIIFEARREATTTHRFPAAIARVWKTKAPQKASLTAWRILRNRLPTCDNLVKRNVMLGEEETKCKFCDVEKETVEHLFLRCTKAAEIWDAIQTWIGYTMVRPNTIDKHFEVFVYWHNGKKIRNLLQTMWVCTIWLMWRRRNEQRFVGVAGEKERLIMDIKVRTWSWNNIFEITSKELSFAEWCSKDLISKIM